MEYCTAVHYPPMQDIKIGLVNMQSVVGDSATNLQSMRRWAEKAASKGVEILCYPEVSVTGYDCSGAGALYPECIPTIPGRETDQLCRLAAETGMMLCVNPSAQVWCHECLRQQHDALDGLARRLPGLLERAPSGVVYNTQLVINSDGTIQGKYRKTHPGISELPTFNAGDDLPVFSHPKITFGIQICYDTHFPIPAALLAEQGAQLIFAPHASAVEVVSAASGSTGTTSENNVATIDAHFAPGQKLSREPGAAKLERWLRYVPARAYDNSIFVAICNQCGLGPAADAQHRRAHGGGASFDGGSVSFVCGPTGEVIAGGGGGDGGDYVEESLLVHLLEAAELERVRSSAISFFRRWHHPRTRAWANAVEGSRL